MQTPWRWTLAIVMGLVVVNCTRAPYILPLADGGPESSPPSFDGRISKVGSDQIDVEVDRSDGSTPVTFVVRFTDTTETFTVYGGLVRRSELTAGQRVRVWLTKPGPPRKRGTSYAAVVMLASKDPHDDWP